MEQNEYVTHHHQTSQSFVVKCYNNDGNPQTGRN